MSQNQLGVMHKASILDLPEELLDQIAALLVPRPSERIWKNARSVPRAVIREFDGWKETCMSIRLVCRKFSKLRQPKYDLFHTVYWLPTRRSMTRLREISVDLTIAPMVRRLTFVATYQGCLWTGISSDGHDTTHMVSERESIDKFSTMLEALKLHVALLPNIR